jgi:UbiD family decarboxylase
MPHDLRAWIERLDEIGDLQSVSLPVDLNGEVAEVCRRVTALGGRPVLFENVRGHENSWCRKLFTGGLSSAKYLAMMLGADAATPPDEIQKLLRARFNQPIDPISVATGPVKEHIITGDDIDLTQIPVPLWHPGDGGRYIATMCATVTRDPATGQHNLGQYRGMVIGKDRIGVLLIPSKGWGTVYDRYRALGQPMPVALVFGWDQSMVFTAGIPLPRDEYTVMGALLGEPVPLVKCETSEIMVPTSAEIVVEGFISTDPATYEMEGPYGEAGVYSTPQPRPVIQVSCISHRTDPIYRAALTGVRIPGGMDEMFVIAMNGLAALLWNVLEAQDIPGVLDVAVGSMAVVKIKKTYQGQPRQIAAAIWGSKLALTWAKIVVVVEDGVDIHDPLALQAAIATHLDPARGIVTYPLQMGSYADPALSLESQNVDEYGSGLMDRLLIDATVDWTSHPRRAVWGGRRLPLPSDDHFSEIEAMVAKRWPEYGIS